MKRLTYLLSILILFQSCYSYKTFDLKNYETLKPKKVKVVLNDSRKFKGKITEIKNDKLILISSKEIIEIPISQIKKIKKRSYSYFKTGATILGATILIKIIAVLIIFTVGF